MKKCTHTLRHTCVCLFLVKNSSSHEVDACCGSGALLTSEAKQGWLTPDRAALCNYALRPTTWAKLHYLFCNEGDQIIQVQKILWQIGSVTSERALCPQLCAIASRTRSQRRCCSSSSTGVRQLPKDRHGNTTSTLTPNSCRPRRPRGRAPSHKASGSVDGVFTLLQKVKYECESWKKKYLNCCKYLGVFFLFFFPFCFVFLQIPHHERTLVCNWQSQPYHLVSEDEISKGLDKNSTVESRESCLVYIRISFHL